MTEYRPMNVMTDEQFASGLRQTLARLSEQQKAILLAQYQMQGHRGFAREIGAAVGLHHAPVNAEYARIAKLFCEATSFRLASKDAQREDGGMRWWPVLSWGVAHGRGRFEWVMHSGLVRAMRQVTTEETVVQYPEELAALTLQEGAVVRVAVDRHERNRAARDACIATYGCHCYIYGLDFEEKYGEVGRGFIHVHHLNPLGDTSGERTVNPVVDLRPVCPNCHAMLHRTSPPLGLAELASRLQPPPSEGELAEWLEREKHKERGIPYPPD